MLTNIIAAIDRYRMIEKGDKITVAVSGGADSVFLLECLTLLKERLEIKLCACHVNHCLRGEESDRDESFVRELCDKLEIPLEVRKVDVKSLVKKHQSIEETARKARYDFFAELCADGSKIATAHTASDSAETVLINLIRGTALKGLCGIPPVRGSIIRPLIFVQRAEIERYCSENGWAYVIDSTNLSEDYTRNKIRHNVLPLIKELNPSVVSGISRMTAALAEDNALLDEAAEKAKNDAEVKKGYYDKEALRRLSKPILNRALKLIFTENEILPTGKKLELARETLFSDRAKLNIEKDKFVIADRLYFYVKHDFQRYRGRLWKGAEMNVQHFYELENGVKIPSIGFGTWQSKEGPETENAVRMALEAGYRHIDTASAYGNEVSVGKAIAESGLDRGEIFVTTKLWNDVRGFDETIAAFEQSLERLGLDYADLYLIHWPNPLKYRTCWKQANAQSWAALEKLYNDGRIKAIGVSNFRPKHFDALLETAKIVPMVNQIRLCPGDVHEETVEFCRKNNILLEGYSPFGQGKAFGVEEIKQLAEKYGKTVSQICVRWSLEMGFLPLPKSVTAGRIAENKEVFDFELSKADVDMLTKLAGACGIAPDPDERNF